jgi:hypothetical protein
MKTVAWTGAARNIAFHIVNPPQKCIARGRVATELTYEVVAVVAAAVDDDNIPVWTQPATIPAIRIDVVDLDLLLSLMAEVVVEPSFVDVDDDDDDIHCDGFDKDSYIEKYNILARACRPSMLFLAKMVVLARLFFCCCCWVDDDKIPNSRF